jgi:hypothetical protein
MSAMHMAAAHRGARVASNSSSFARATAIWLPPALQPQQSVAVAAQSPSAVQAVSIVGAAPTVLPGEAGAAAGAVAGA